MQEQHQETDVEMRTNWQLGNEVNHDTKDEDLSPGQKSRFDKVQIINPAKPRDQQKYVINKAVPADQRMT